MEEEGKDNDSNPRYYASKQEQPILIWGLRQYFSFPERSSNRNRIAAQVTSFLQNISPHWTHRAVRLWFNNNKKQYFNENQAHFYQQMANQFNQFSQQNQAFQAQVPPMMAQPAPIPSNTPQIPQKLVPKNAIFPPTSPQNAGQQSPNMPNMIGFPMNQALKLPQTQPLQAPLQQSQQQQQPKIAATPIHSKPIETNLLKASLVKESQISLPQQIPQVIPQNPLIDQFKKQQMALPNSNFASFPPTQTNQPVALPIRSGILPPQKPQNVAIPAPQKQQQSTNQIIEKDKNENDLTEQIIPSNPTPAKNPQAIIGDNQSPANVIMLPAIRPPPPKVRFEQSQTQQQDHNPIISHSQHGQINQHPELKTMNIMQNETLLTPLQPKQPDNNYTAINGIIQQLKKIDVSKNQKEFNELSDKFDAQARNIIGIDGQCIADRIEFGLPFVRIRMPQDITTDDLLVDIPSDFSVPSKSYSFLDSTDTFLRPSTPDLFPMRAVWQDRRFSEIKLVTYDTVFITKSKAAYAYSDVLKSEKIISVADLNTDPTNWQNYPVPSHSQIDELIVTDKYGFSCADDKIIRTSLHNQSDMPQNSNVCSIPRDKATGNPFLAQLKDDCCLIGYAQSKHIFLYDDVDLKELNILPFNGITSLQGFNDDSFLCSPESSFSIRQLNLQSQEIRSYVGHCNYVRQIIQKDNNSFLSRADDNTVRLWDCRTPLPQMQILTQASAMCYDGNYIVIGMPNKGLAIIDIREAKTKLCVPTQDYNPEAIAYNQEKDELIMFGVIARDVVKDSMMFIDNDGQSRKRVFRKYHNFVSIGV